METSQLNYLPSIMRIGMRGIMRLANLLQQCHLIMTGIIQHGRGVTTDSKMPSYYVK
jgi:hypothetical protein